MIYYYTGLSFGFLLLFVFGIVVVGVLLYLIIRGIVRSVKKRKWFKEHPDEEYYIPDNND